MLKEYYINKLYPLQDIVLNEIAKYDTDFYLTGWTALSRCYLHHRFSDDLDFFVNGKENFTILYKKCTKGLIEANLEIIIDKESSDFVRINCVSNNIKLKIDFVNDIPYRSDSIINTPIYLRTDSWWNILSNKICALERREAKDVTDILFICRKYSFSWDDVFIEANKKTTYIDALDISVIIDQFPVEYFSKVNFCNELNLNDALVDLKAISKDILEKKENSIYKLFRN